MSSIEQKTIPQPKYQCINENHNHKLAKGYKSDNKSVLGGVVLVLILVNQANTSTVIGLTLCRFIIK